MCICVELVPFPVSFHTFRGGVKLELFLYSFSFLSMFLNDVLDMTLIPHVQLSWHADSFFSFSQPSSPRDSDDIGLMIHGKITESGVVHSFHRIFSFVDCITGHDDLREFLRRVMAIPIQSCLKKAGWHSHLWVRTYHCIFYFLLFVSSIIPHLLHCFFVFMRSLGSVLSNDYLSVLHLRLHTF